MALYQRAVLVRVRDLAVSLQQRESLSLEKVSTRVEAECMQRDANLPNPPNTVNILQRVYVRLLQHALACWMLAARIPSSRISYSQQRAYKVENGDARDSCFGYLFHFPLCALCSTTKITVIFFIFLHALRVPLETCINVHTYIQTHLCDNIIFV